MSDSNLTLKQEAFCRAYVIDFDSVAAAKTAGYSEKSLQSLSSQLLANPKVKKRIEEMLDEFSANNKQIKNFVLRQLLRAATADINEYTNVEAWDELPRWKRQLITEFQETTRHTKNDSSTTYKFKLMDKNKAIELLGKHVAMFTDKVEHSTEPFVIDLGEDGQITLGMKEKEE